MNLHARLARAITISVTNALDMRHRICYAAKISLIEGRIPDAICDCGASAVQADGKASTSAAVERRTGELLRPYSSCLRGGWSSCRAPGTSECVARPR